MRHLDLFSGIGGFALAAQTVWGPEYENVGFCDNEPFAQAILKKHWPNAKIYDDIKELRTPPTTDLVTGGFPCQPFSAAGKRRGTEDDRHLWPEMLRVIRASSPRWVIGENVGGLLTWNNGMVLDQVCADLEGEGYQVWPLLIPAAGVGAPHLRNRVWIIAHSSSGGDGGKSRDLRKTQRRSQPRDLRDSGGSDQVRNGPHAALERLQGLGDEVHQPGPQPDDQQPHGRSRGGPAGTVENTSGKRRRGRDNGDTKGDHGEVQTAGPNTSLHKITPHPDSRGVRRHQRKGAQKGATACGSGSWDQDWPSVAARLCPLDDGLPNGLARPRGWRNAALKGAGNAIVPQVAIQIMRAIKEIDQ